MSDSIPLAATLRDRIAQLIRTQILSGDLADDSRIDLDALAEQFGSSRTPVREALIQLSHDGLVEILPRRGIRVRGMSIDTIRDNFDVFGGLFGLAADWATRRADPDLVPCLRRFEGALEPHPQSERLVVENWQFHRAINKACGSERLIAMISQLSRTMPDGYFEMIPEQAEVSVCEHRALVDAIASGDNALARSLAEEHIRAAGDRMVARLELKSAAPQPAVGE